MKIYISIPISGYIIDMQKRKAARIAKKIEAAGHTPVNPFDTLTPQKRLDEKRQYAYYMDMDIAQLLTCDAAFFCPGWGSSKGCRLVHYAAWLFGLKTFHSLVQIPDAVKSPER